MSESSSPKDRLKMSKFKLDALLDITLSINANLPTRELLAKYQSILREELGIGKILLYKFSEKWEVLLNSGFPEKLQKTISVERDLLCFEDITTEVPDDPFTGVDIIIPVFNNNLPLAFVLIGDIDEEGEGMSPVIKHLHFMQTISSIIVVAIENLRLVKESLKQEAIRRELELAARMQMMLIPDNSKLPATDKIKALGFYHPHYEVGGDYYDFVALSDDVVGFCMADVSGKGISAAMLMSNFQASLHALFTAEIDLDILIRKLNSIVIANSSGERFLTLFISRYNIISHELEYVNAAHNPPVLIDVNALTTSMLKTSCVGIGMLDEIPFIKKEKIILPSYCKIVCYTDGLSELKDQDGNDLGASPIIKHFPNSKPISDNLAALIEDVDIHDTNPGLFDDVSILAVEVR